MSKFIKIGVFITAVILGVAIKLNYDTSKQQQALSQQIQSIEIDQFSDHLYENQYVNSNPKTVVTSALNPNRDNITSLLSSDPAIGSVTKQYMQEKKQQDEQKVMPIQSQLFYKDTLRKWDEAVYLVHVTERKDLTQPIKKLQDVKSILENKITSTDCEKVLKREMLRSFDMTIDAYLKYLIDDSDKPDIGDGEIAEQFDKTETLMTEC